jgi:hypothetical protein
MSRPTGQKRSANTTFRYLNSPTHGPVPVLRAGGETYLWMPGSSGGENVWRHVLITGTSPGTARKRIALKAGSPSNASLATGEGSRRVFQFSSATEEPTGAYARLDLSEINAPSEAISNPEVQVDAFAEVLLYHSRIAQNPRNSQVFHSNGTRIYKQKNISPDIQS